MKRVKIKTDFNSLCKVFFSTIIHSMRCVVANDHGAVSLARRLTAHLKERGIDVNYLGTDKEESVDYPDQAEKCAKEFLKGGYDFALVLCGTGIGISIASNKIKGIRCALVQDSYSAEMAKRHNNANMLSFGGRIDYKEEPEKILDAFIDAEFEGGRHQRRIDKITALENHR